MDYLAMHIQRAENRATQYLIRGAESETDVAYTLRLALNMPPTDRVVMIQPLIGYPGLLKGAEWITEQVARLS